MGTSSSSSGPGGGVPFDPPWLDSIASEIGSPADKITGESPDSDEQPQQPEPGIQPIEVAPQRRFIGARRYLGDYIRTGNRNSLKKSFGSYSSRGMGGASNVARRMRASTSAGAGLYEFFNQIRDASNIKIKEWVEQLTLKSLSAAEIINEIIDQVVSSGGSLEEESIRDSMAQAMAELIELNPEINLMNMDSESIWNIIELFMAKEVCNRLNLDIGQAFESTEYSLHDTVVRMNEMKEYLKSEVSAQIQELRSNTINPSKSEINDLLQSALKVTFEIFEEEI